MTSPNPKITSKPSHVLVVGDVILDRYFEGTANRISPEAPVPILHHLSTRSTLGGAANVACSIAAMGGQASILGFIGDDQDGIEVLECFREFNRNLLQREYSASVEIDGLLKRRSWPTIVKTRLVAGNHQLARIDREECCPLEREAEEQLIEVFLKKLDECSTVVISDYAKGCINEKIVRVIIDKACAAGKEVIVDPKQVDLSFYRGCTLLTPNRSELERYWKTELGSELDIEQALRKAAENTSASILVTRAQEGATFLHQGAISHISAQEVDVSDVSGAGDTLVATLAVFRSEGDEWIDAIKKAVDAATKSVRHSGVVQIFREELKEYMEGSAISLTAPIYSCDNLVAALKTYESWKKSHLRCVMTNGCFDLLHKGHLSSLIKSRALGDRLIVALNSDDSVKLTKGLQRPIITESVRAELLAALKCVDMVIVFNEKTPINLIKTLKPDILVKGEDYILDKIVGADFVQSYGGQVIRMPLEESWSTSAIVRKIKDA